MTQHYKPKRYEKDKLLRQEILKLAGKYPSYGYRMITKKLRQVGSVCCPRCIRKVKTEKPNPPPPALIEGPACPGFPLSALPGRAPAGPAWQHFYQDRIAVHPDNLAMLRLCDKRDANKVPAGEAQRLAVGHRHPAAVQRYENIIILASRPQR